LSGRVESGIQAAVKHERRKLEIIILLKEISNDSGVGAR
jgi:hypothetical protein